MTTYTCPCVSRHVPQAVALQTHHILPLSWGGERYRNNEVRLCPSTHENIHTLLNHYVRHGGLPPWDIRRLFGLFVRQYAERAWRQRPSDKPPYTKAAE